MQPNARRLHQLLWTPKDAVRTGVCIDAGCDSIVIVKFHSASSRSTDNALDKTERVCKIKFIDVVLFAREVVDKRGDFKV
jgi:hypothetical protein